MALVDRVRRFTAHHHLWRQHTRVVAAVSGGSDSVAMVLVLHDFHSRGELQLKAIAHLNHLIRGAATDDERFCRELAERLGVPFVASSADVPAIARDKGQSIEVAGRQVRRAFLLDVRRTRGADVIATAHTRDDQAETVLLRVLRGAGGRGLGGISPYRNPFIRPVLFASRDELRDELHHRGVSWREDETNADVANPRNRVRHELLPYLETHFNPSTRQSLARLADIVRADEEHLSREAVAASAHALLRAQEGRVQLDRDVFARLPPALRRRVVLHALAASRPTHAPSLRDVEAVEAVVSGDFRGVEISGLRVEHSGRSVVLLRKAFVASPVQQFTADLQIPGEVRWNEAGVLIQAEGPFPRFRVASIVGADAVVSADGLSTPLHVRSRAPGDRVRPLGLGGRKKLQDVLTDRKVPRNERDHVPIVTDAQGHIVWVAGHVVGEEFRVTDRTNAVIILKLRRI